MEGMGRELLLERLERLAIALDELMPQCAELVRDAIAMLKEQEAIKPVPPEDEFGLYRCGRCYHQLFRCVDKYCSRCGKAVKWK